MVLWSHNVTIVIEFKSSQTFRFNRSRPYSLAICAFGDLRHNFEWIERKNFRGLKVKGSVSCHDVFLIQSLFCTIGRKQAERSQTRWVQRGHKSNVHRQNADICSTGKLKKSKGMRLQQEHILVFSVCQNVWDIKRHYIYNGFIQRIATKALSQCLSGVHMCHI